MEAAVAEEKKKLLAENRDVLKYDGGMFKFPLATYTRVSRSYHLSVHIMPMRACKLYIIHPHVLS